MDPIINNQMLHLVFEHRNKNYGAFEMRENYNRRLKRSFLYVMLLLSIIPLAGYIQGGSKTPQLTLDRDIKDFGKTDADMDGFLKYLESLTTVSSSEHALTIIAPDPPQKKPDPQVVPSEQGTGYTNGTSGGFFQGTGFGKTGGTKTGTTMFPAVIPLVPPIVTHPDEWPIFPGGSDALQDFLDDHLVAPENLDSEVPMLVEFVVEADGSLSGVKVIQGDGYLAESLHQAIGAMPKWIPGKSGGQKVRVLCRMPVLFKP